MILISLVSAKLFLLLEILTLVKTEERLHGDLFDEDSGDHSRARTDSNRDSHHYYDREGWKVVTDNIAINEYEEEVVYQKGLGTEDDDAYNKISSEGYSDYFSKSPKDKYSNYWTINDYQPTQLESKDHYTYQPHRQFLESANYGDNHYTTPYVKYGHDKSSEQVPSQAPGVILFLIDLLDSALEARRPKNRTSLDNVTLGNRVTIDTVTAIQELMLKFLEFFAFVATDLLFQLFWPI